MKSFFLIASFAFIFTSLTKAQSQVRDTHPEANIFAIDYQSGQEAPANSDAAILFKDAFIDLVMNTQSARMHIVKVIPGHKTLSIMQVDPKTSNGFQLTLQSKFLGQTTTIYSYLYDTDQNALYYFDPNQQNWTPETIQDNNVTNLNNCFAFGKFNYPQQQAQAPDLSANNSLQSQQTAETDAPIDSTVSATTVPPVMPDYEQPECPDDGYLWQPGFWAYSPYRGNYYWVPGAWVAPPNPGLLWTPPYWGFYGGRYVFHTGYWGTSVGFYGGINYGYGYQGRGYVGGEWQGGRFRYNTAVVRVNTVTVHNVYVNNTVINRTVVNNHVSFNGNGGVMARPTPGEVQAMRGPRIMPTQEQVRNQQIARADKGQFASPNGGKPANLAAPHVPAAPVNQPTVRTNNPAPANNARPGAPATTNNNTRPGMPANNNPATNNNNVRSAVPNGRPNAPAGNVPPVPSGFNRQQMNNNNNNNNQPNSRNRVQQPKPAPAKPSQPEKKP